MEAAYAAEYPALYRRHWWWRVRERILLEKIRELLGRRAGDARILDVGCGGGLFFDALEPFGRVEGIESDPIAVDQSGRWRSRIHLGKLDDFTAAAPFDLILALDVVEHVRDPDGLLRQAAKLLAHDGHMLITTPAFEWLWTSHDTLNHHVKRYTAAEMRALVRKAGLQTVNTQYLFQSLVLPKLLVRTREAIRPSAASVPHIPAPIINRALQMWFRSEHAIAGWLPFGSSVLTVAGVTHE